MSAAAHRVAGMLTARQAALVQIQKDLLLRPVLPEAVRELPLVLAAVAAAVMEA